MQVDANGEDVYVVEYICGMKKGPDGRDLFLIKWEGYDDSWNTWEPASNLDAKPNTYKTRM